MKYTGNDIHKKIQDWKQPLEEKKLKKMQAKYISKKFSKQKQ